MRTAIPAPLIALGLAALAAGCADTHTTEVETVRGTADALLEMCAADRPQDALEVLDPPARQAFLRAGGARAGCLEVLGLRASRLAPAATADVLRRTRVANVRAGDLSAHAEIRSPTGERASLELEKSRGVWYVAHPARSGVSQNDLSSR